MTILELLRSKIDDSLISSHDEATGDGTSTKFQLDNIVVYPDSYKVYVAGTLKTETTHYTLDKANGLVTFVTAPANLAEITIDYQYSDFTDAELDIFLNKYKSWVEFYLTGEDSAGLIYTTRGGAIARNTQDFAPETVSYADSASAKHQDLDGSLYDANGDILDDASPSIVSEADYIGGIFTFTTSPGTVIFKGWEHDTDSAASDLWLVCAGKATSGTVKIGDVSEQVMDKTNREFCIQQHWNVRKSKSTSARRV